jgi:calcium permeable stress-gated cation channel
MLYKYLFTWVLEQPASSDTGGLFFPKAIHHMFVGMYVQQICLVSLIVMPALTGQFMFSIDQAALFFLARDQNREVSAVPEGALMIVLLAFTVKHAFPPLRKKNIDPKYSFGQAFFHILISDSFGPLIHFLPMSLADRTFTEENRNSEENHSLLHNAAPNPRFSASSDREKGRQSESENIKPNTQKSQETPTNAAAESHDHDKQPQIVQTGKGEVIDYGFAQPAASRPQPVIWFPKDTLGLADEAEAMLKSAGIDVTTKGAEMDEFGHVKISTAPPGLEASN